MGERIFRLGVTSFGFKEEEMLREFFLKNNKSNYAFKEKAKWYDLQVDLARLSKHFPCMVFYCAFIGENNDDNEYVISHRGCTMPPQDQFAFKLPLTEKANQLIDVISQIEREIEGNPKEQDILDSLNNELSLERRRLIDLFFGQMNLIDISDYFCF